MDKVKEIAVLAVVVALILVGAVMYKEHETNTIITAIERLDCTVVKQEEK